MVSYREPPPSYAEAVGSDTGNAPAIVAVYTIVDIDQQQQQQQPRQMVVRQNRQNNIVDRSVIGTVNASNSFSGILDILYNEKKLPWGFLTNMIYKLGLFIYYFVNFLYSIVAVAVQKDHLAYHIVYVLISTIGALFELIVIIIDMRKRFTRSSDAESTTEVRRNQVAQANQQRQAWTVETRADEYSHKAKSALLDYLLLSLGEFLIHPTLICTLYGFINERTWRFDNGISGCNFLFFLYSVIMDGVYIKFYALVIVIRVVGVTYEKYNQLLHPVVEWKRYFTPVYLTVPFTAVMALTHWFMIGIVGVRIYVDNFTPEKHDIDTNIPNTGDYKVTPLTGCMIACTIYLPIVSWITYTILNKPWFYEVYSAINQMTNGADRMPQRDSWDNKLFAFIKDPLAYIAVVFLIGPFVTFAVGAYLADYDSSDYEIAYSARNALEGLAPCFITLFLLANLQAIIISIIVALMIATIVSCIVIVLCVVEGYVCSLCDNN